MKTVSINLKSQIPGVGKSHKKATANYTHKYTTHAGESRLYAGPPFINIFFIGAGYVAIQLKMQLLDAGCVVNKTGKNNNILKNSRKHNMKT